ncbi:MAG: single-stranded-DNA-specific exonuclease RecJ, partial [Phototrophicales bacterium]
LKPLIKIDAQVNFNQINLDLYQQIDSLQPWGIGNDFPVFWTPQVRVLQQRVVGKQHLKLTLMQLGQKPRLAAIAWRWGEYYPLPELIDVAYKLKQNVWQQQQTVQLELIGARAC